MRPSISEISGGSTHPSTQTPAAGIPDAATPENRAHSPVPPANANVGGGGSSVAGGAIHQWLLVDPVMVQQGRPLRALVRRQMPFRVVDFPLRAQRFFRLAMAIQAPFHIERCRAVSERHPVHRAVATAAPYPVLHMHGVVEVNEIR